MRFPLLRWAAIVAVLLSALPWEEGPWDPPRQDLETTVSVEREALPTESESPSGSDSCPSGAFCLCCAAPSALCPAEEGIRFARLPTDLRMGERVPQTTPLGDYGPEVFHPPERA